MGCRGSSYTATNYPGIKGGQSRTVLFKPLSGLLTQPKYLPLRYCPLTIELELISDSTLPIVSYFDGYHDFTSSNTSLAFTIGSKPRLSVNTSYFASAIVLWAVLNS